MRRSDAIKRIGILGHVGNSNLGDEAILASVIQNIRNRYPDAEIYGFTINPEDTRQRHNIPSFPIRQGGKTSQTSGSQPVPKSPLRVQLSLRLKTMLPLLHQVLKTIEKALHTAWVSFQELGFLIRCFKAMKGIDLLIIAGSHQLSDQIEGPWAFPYTLLKWSLVARAAKTKVAFLSVGAGPVTSGLSRLFLRRALARASYLSFRDQNSKTVVETLGLSRNGTVLPDLAHSLRLPSFSCLPDRPSSLAIAGINPMPFFHIRFRHRTPNRMHHERYVETLARFASWLIERGYGVLFFPTQLRADPPVINEVKAAMRRLGVTCSAPHVIEIPISSLDDLIATIALTDVVVATRYHGILLALLLQRAVLGISYQEKSTELMRNMGQDEYALNIDSLHLDVLKERFASLESRSPMIKRELRQAVSLARQALDTQYDELFRLCFGAK